MILMCWRYVYTGTGVPVGLLLMQCTNAGQVVARAGTAPGGGSCVAAAQPQVMSAVPILDNEDGTLELRSAGGRDYVKVYDPALGKATWQVMPPDMATAYSSLLPKLDTITPGTGNTAVLPKLADIASMFEKAGDGTDRYHTTTTTTTTTTTVSPDVVAADAGNPTTNTTPQEAEGGPTADDDHFTSEPINNDDIETVGFASGASRLMMLCVAVAAATPILAAALMI